MTRALSTSRRAGGARAGETWRACAGTYTRAATATGARVRAAARGDRGDVPGWVMVTLMTAGLVVALWAVAGPRLQLVFTTAMDRVLGGG
ncbi:hypothetical protein [Pseudokineococcus sp. 1T1Z-3]